MDKGATLTRRPLPRQFVGGRSRRRRWSRAPHHRRRRAVAVLVLGGVVALGLVLALPGGSRPVLHPRPAPTAFLERVQTLASDGPGSFAAAELAAENQAINRTLSYTPWVRWAGSQHRELALTFDDGPGPYTPEILAVLRREKVPATFFEIGFLEQWFHSSTSEIVAMGDAIGDHTFTHPPMSFLSAVEQRAELLDQAHAIERYGARFPRLFRPPYGVWNATTLALLHRYRMLMVLWTVDTSDYLLPGVDTIVREAVSGARPGAIILLHDAGGDRSETVAALPKIIAALRARGYRLVTVPRLLLDNPAPHNQSLGGLGAEGT